MSKNKVCVILPCFKVKHKIFKVYKKLIKLNIDKIIFIDDYCPDQSVKFLQSKIKKTKKIQFIFLKKNNGVGGATLKGFNIAINQGYNILLKFDSDNQHRVKDLMKIISKLKRNDVLFCKGYRNLNITNYFNGQMPLIRILGTNALTLISRLITLNFFLNDVTNGLFGIKAKLYKKINTKIIKKNYFFEQDLIFNVCMQNVTIHQIKSKVLYENETSSLKILKILLPFTFYHIQNILRKYL